MNLFQLLEESETARRQHNQQQLQPDILLVGDKHAGKTTLLNQLTSRTNTADDATPKPTTALEYRYARHTSLDATGAGAAPNVANLWELAGGTQLADLLHVVLTPSRLARCSIAITLNMGAPGDALATLLFWLDALRRRIDAILAELRVSDAGAADAFEARLAAEWVDHADADAVRPIGLPVVVFAHKWDEFEASFGESELRKLATRALRHFCHMSGASLLCTKSKDRTTMGAACTVLNHYAFGTPALESMQIDHSRPVVAIAGKDSLASIGRPPRVDGASASTADEGWKVAYEVTFPSSGGADKASDISAVDSEKFSEEAVDLLRRQRKDDVDRLRLVGALGGVAAEP